MAEASVLEPTHLNGSDWVRMSPPLTCGVEPSKRTFVVIVTGVLSVARVGLPRWFWVGLMCGTGLGVVFMHWLIFETLYEIGALCALDESVIGLDLNQMDGYVGVSAGGDCRLEGLAAWISSIRAVSKNRAITIMLGGPHFVARPELAALFGADATAADARTAVRQAEILTARPS